MNPFKEWWPRRNSKENRYDSNDYYLAEKAFTAGRDYQREKDAQIAAGDAITPGCTALLIAKAIREQK